MNLLPIELYFTTRGSSPTWHLLREVEVFCALEDSSPLVRCHLMDNISTWLMALNPPDNGFANAVYLVSGWFWLLPIFGIIGAVFRFVESRLSSNRQFQIGSNGYRICAGIGIAVLFLSIFGRMSEERATIEARKQIKLRGYEPTGREIPEYDDGHWIIRYPDSDFGEIRLTRNGGMSWIGGPG